MEIKIDEEVTLFIDEEDYRRVKDYRLTYYRHHRNNNPYFVIFIGKTRYWLHRYILGCKMGDKTQVDHINGQPWDNRKNNLRICTKGRYNAINRPKQKNNTTGYKGVGAKGNKFFASLRYNQKNIHLGVFFTKEEAAQAYNQAATEYFGEFAYLNIITES